jgi:hypothetical protein
MSHLSLHCSCSLLFFTIYSTVGCAFWRGAMRERSARSTNRHRQSEGPLGPPSDSDQAQNVATRARSRRCMLRNPPRSRSIPHPRPSKEDESTLGVQPSSERRHIRASLLLTLKPTSGSRCSMYWILTHMIHPLHILAEV